MPSEENEARIPSMERGMRENSEETVKERQREMSEEDEARKHSVEVTEERVNWVTRLVSSTRLKHPLAA